MFLQVCGSRGPRRIVLGYGGGQGESGPGGDSAEQIQTEITGKAAVCLQRHELFSHEDNLCHSTMSLLSHLRLKHGEVCVKV